MFADVTSANIVGYTTSTTDASSYSFGSTFVEIGENSKWQLSQLKPVGTAGGYDIIQFLNTANASIYLSATYYSEEEAGDEAGWCNAADEDEMLDSLEITPGTAVLANISDGREVAWTFSGAVIEAGNDGYVTVDVSGQGSPFIANPLPREITLGDIVPTGVRGGYDIIQFLNPNNASVYLSATYYSVEEAGDDAGWCNAADEDEMLTDQPIKPGEAFLGNIGIDDSPNAKFIFPSAL